MARPSISEIESDERLSLACGELSQALEAIGSAAAYVRMMVRREPRLIEFAELADRWLANAVDGVDGAQVKIRLELAAAQARRSAHNRVKHETDCH